MATYSKSGHVSLTDIDTYEKDLGVYGGDYTIKNTDDHGKIKFKIKSKKYYHSSSGAYTSKWSKVVDVVVNHGDSHSGNFAAAEGETEDYCAPGAYCPRFSTDFEFEVLWEVTTHSPTYYSFTITY